MYLSNWILAVLNCEPSARALPGELFQNTVPDIILLDILIQSV